MKRSGHTSQSVQHRVRPDAVEVSFGQRAFLGPGLISAVLGLGLALAGVAHWAAFAAGLTLMVVGLMACLWTARAEIRVTRAEVQVLGWVGLWAPRRADLRLPLAGTEFEPWTWNPAGTRAWTVELRSGGRRWVFRRLALLDEDVVRIASAVAGAGTHEVNRGGAAAVPAELSRLADAAKES